MFDDAFDVNPSMDVRKTDQLVYPTCTPVNLPMEESKWIVMPKEEVGEDRKESVAVGEDWEAAAVGEEGGDGNIGADTGTATDTNGSGINDTAYFW